MAAHFINTMSFFVKALTPYLFFADKICCKTEICRDAISNISLHIWNSKFYQYMWGDKIEVTKRVE